LYQAGGWTGLQTKIIANLHSDSYFHLWRDTGSFAANPMGVHWTGSCSGWVCDQLWVLDHGLPGGAAGAGGAQFARRADGAADRVIFQDGGSFIVILPGCWGWCSCRIRMKPASAGGRGRDGGVHPERRGAGGGFRRLFDGDGADESHSRAAAEGAQRRPNAELHTYNQALPLMMVRYLGPGLLGLGITALIAGS